MATLAEILKNKFSSSKPAPVVAPTRQEKLIENPLGLLIGSDVKIQTVDLEDLNFSTQAIREIKASLPSTSQSFFIGDYDLLARPLGAEPVRKRLRVTPAAEADTGYTHDTVLLNFVASFPYDKDYHNGLAFEENQGEAQEGDDHFWRVGDLHDPWEVNTKYIVDQNNVRSGQMTYWDFWRETEDSDGKTIREFYIVEMNGIVAKDNAGNIVSQSGTGMFEIWRGSLIEPSRVKTL